MFFDNISLEIMSDGHLVERRPPILYKYGFHVVAILNFFKVVKQSYDFRQKLKISLFVFRTKWALKKCLMIIQLGNKPSQTKKILILHSGNIAFFSKGLTDDFGQKLKLYSFYYFEQNRPRNIVCSSSSSKNKVSQTIKY